MTSVPRGLARFAICVSAAASAVPTLTLAQERPPGVVQPSVRIGEGEAHEFSFSRISGLAVDALGFLYVADAQEHRVDVFALGSAHVATIGRRGRGPGEFQHPTSIAAAPDGTIWVRDMNRIQRFTRDEPSAPATRYAAVVNGPPMADWMSQRTGVVDRDGLVHVPQSFTLSRTDPPRYVQLMFRVGADGAIRDSIVAPHYPGPAASFAIVRLSATDGRMLRGLGYAPFTPVRQWASTPRGTIISGDARSYLLVETDAAGREVRRFTRPYQPVPIDASERRDSLRALSARLDSITVPLSQVEGMSDDVRARRLPADYPAHREVAVSGDGVLWVRRWSDATTRARSVFDVFDAEARFLGTVVLAADLRADPVLVIMGSQGAGIEVDPETGLEMLVRFTVPASFRGETGPSVRP
jgi:hypothetical protein